MHIILCQSLLPHAKSATLSREDFLSFASVFVRKPADPSETKLADGKMRPSLKSAAAASGDADDDAAS